MMAKFLPPRTGEIKKKKAAKKAAGAGHKLCLRSEPRRLLYFPYIKLFPDQRDFYAYAHA